MIAKRTNTLALFILLMLPAVAVASTGSGAVPGGSAETGVYHDDDDDDDDDGRRRHRDRDRDRDRYRHDDDDDDDDGYRRKHGYRHDKWEARIPRGHYPPAGYCRVWYPGRAPGHQPAPVHCGALRPRHVGVHAVVLTHRGIWHDWHDAYRRADYVYKPVPKHGPRVEVRWDVRGGWIIGR